MYGKAADRWNIPSAAFVPLTFSALFSQLR
jgi:hypothetical protein